MLVILKYLLYALLLSAALIVAAHFGRGKSKRDKELEELKGYLQTIATTVNSVRYGNLAKKIDIDSYEKYKGLSETINRMIETLYDREQMIIESQTELRNQNKFLEASLNSLSDGIIIIDEQGHILRASDNIHKWFNNSKLLGTNILDYVTILDEKNLHDLCNNEVYISASPELSFSADCNKLELEDKHNRYVIVLKNISNQKEIETLKEDFIATLTHDLKVPIVAESNMLDLLLTEKFGTISDRQKEALEYMKSSNKELIDLVQTVLETYKIKSTGISLYKESFNLSEFLKNIIVEMQPIASHTSNNLKLDMEEHICINADSLHLKRVLKNLINNAISYGSNGTDIDIKACTSNSEIIITVKDYGKGIPPEDIKKIFQKYYSTAKKFRKTGTGLGLFLAQEIVKAHDGTLNVTSELDNYTEFCIKLPQ